MREIIIEHHRKKILSPSSLDDRENSLQKFEEMVHERGIKDGLLDALKIIYEHYNIETRNDLDKTDDRVRSVVEDIFFKIDFMEPGT